jgi:hypothetical protein
MTAIETIEFLENGNYIGRDSWPDDRWVCLDLERQICLFKRIKEGKVTVIDYLWPIEDLKATDWTIVFIDEEG